MKKRLTLLCRNMATNAFGRAHLLAELLADAFDVKVIGPQIGPGVWPPMAGLLERKGIEVISFPTRGKYPEFCSTGLQILQSLKADIVYALKPFPSSFGLGLLYRQCSGVPLVLDIDDYELGGYEAREKTGFSFRKLLEVDSEVYSVPLFRRARLADAVTVSSSFLQQRFGGSIVPHGRDEALWQPELFDRESLRVKYGFESKIVLFLGTIRQHKGVEDVMEAVSGTCREDVTCIIAGADEKDAYVAELKAQAGPRVRFVPPVPFSEIPGLLYAADVVVIPQRQTPFSQGQLPAKLFDAMAMGRAVVSTDVSDIGNILEGCGKVVPPNNPVALRRAIVELLDDPLQAQELGARARQKFVADFSYGALRKNLQQVMHGLL